MDTTRYIRYVLLAGAGAPLALDADLDDLHVRFHGRQRPPTLMGNEHRGGHGAPRARFAVLAGRDHFFLSASRRIIWNRVGARSEVVTATALCTNRVSARLVQHAGRKTGAAGEDAGRLILVQPS